MGTVVALAAGIGVWISGAEESRRAQADRENALRAYGELARERLQTALAFRRAVVSVTDTGRGISPKFLPYVFDRFRQADSTSTRSHGGLGIGLTIVRHIVELHGGSVDAHSAGEGKGATFVVTLPVTPA